MHESFKNFSTKFGESYSIINMYMYMAVRIACNEHAVNTIRLSFTVYMSLKIRVVKIVRFF